MSSHTIKIAADIGEDLIEVTVGFDYQPYEPMTRDYPGCPAQVSVFEVMDGKVDITSMLTDAEMSNLEQSILEYRDEDDGA
jgi:hypothetical protein